MHTHRSALSKRQILALLICAALAIAALIFSLDSIKQPFVSAEVHFTDRSVHGLNIMPASCAASPTYYHYTVGMSTVGAGNGYLVPSDGNEYGNYDPLTGQYFCVQNTTGYTVFIPAQTAGELQSFKNIGSSKPGLIVY